MVSIHIEPWGSAAEIATAADHELRSRIESAEMHVVATALAQELVERCDPPRASADVLVQLRLTCAGRVIDRLVRFAGGAVMLECGESAAPAVRVQCDLMDLARLLFGSRHRRESAPWSHELLSTRSSSPEFVGMRRAAVLATRALLGGVRDDVSLDDLAVRFESDKWGELHWYTPHYDRHFAALRDEPIQLLEIGIGGYDDPTAGGGSLQMWQRYFRRGLIHGLDIHAKKVTGPRIRTVQGDQNDPAFLAELAGRIGPLDVVIDDGSHVNEHVLTSFHALFPKLRDGGVYVIEDLQTSYWPSYQGSNRDFDSTRTSVGFLKSLVDGLNHQEYQRGIPSYTDQHVVGLHLYHNLAFVTKGVNDECGPVRIPT